MPCAEAFGTLQRLVPLHLLIRPVAAPDADVLRMSFEQTPIRIGRGDGCEVLIPDPRVDLHHAVIERDGSEYVLIDEASANGTWVGGVRVAAKQVRSLRDGDQIRLGRCMIEVRVQDTEIVRASSTREVAFAIVSSLVRVRDGLPFPCIRVVEGAARGAALSLEGARTFTIGRDERCDLVLEDSQVSREHVRVRVDGNQILLRDAGSKNGATLGGTTLPRHGEVTWNPLLHLRVGAAVLSLEIPPASITDAIDRIAELPLVRDDNASKNDDGAKNQGEVPGEGETEEPEQTASNAAPDQRVIEAPVAAPIAPTPALPLPASDAHIVGQLAARLMVGGTVLVLVAALAFGVWIFAASK